MIFYRADHTTLFIKLNSDEPLGVLDSDYIEDYNGVDGQLSVYNTLTTSRVALVMSAVPGDTPGVSNDVFLGQILLSSLIDGDYQIQGRVRDLLGNYTIVGAFSNPVGDENVMPFNFMIADGAFIPFPGRTFNISLSRRDFTVQKNNRALTI